MEKLSVRCRLRISTMNYAMENLCFRRNQIKPIQIRIEGSFFKNILH